MQKKYDMASMGKYKDLEHILRNNERTQNSSANIYCTNLHKAVTKLAGNWNLQY